MQSIKRITSVLLVVLFAIALIFCFKIIWETYNFNLSDSYLSVRFIDVGEADAALVECDNHFMLIDGGNKSDSQLIYTVLKDSNISKLDVIVATHAHEDHIGGIPGALNYASASKILCPVTSYDSEAFYDFKKYAEKNGGGITVPSVGDSFKLGSALITILGMDCNSDPNNSSIILRIDYGETSFLFTGDAESDAEQRLINSGALLSATLLKVGHHGSGSSTTSSFLSEVMPKYAVISVGSDNSYGHPANSTLSRLHDADVTVYRTDLHGDITVISDGKDLTVFTQKDVSADDVIIDDFNDKTSETTNNVSASLCYILNIKTKRFHYTYCSSVEDMKDSNKEEYYGSRDDLIAQGYKPCGNCNP